MTALLAFTLLASGDASWYAPGVMEATVAYRLERGQVLPCADCRGYVALLDCRPPAADAVLPVEGRLAAGFLGDLAALLGLSLPWTSTELSALGPDEQLVAVALQHWPLVQLIAQQSDADWQPVPAGPQAQVLLVQLSEQHSPELPQPRPACTQQDWVEDGQIELAQQVDAEVQ